MTDLMEIDGVQVVAEEYMRFGDRPVMICVLTMANGLFAIGHSASSLGKFDEELAQLLAKKDAKSFASYRMRKIKNRQHADPWIAKDDLTMTPPRT